MLFRSHQDEFVLGRVNVNRHELAGVHQRMRGDQDIDHAGLRRHPGIGVAQQKPVMGGVGGLGWCQWTAARRTSFVNWLRDNGWGENYHDDEANYGYLLGFQAVAQQLGQVVAQFFGLGHHCSFETCE